MNDIGLFGDTNANSYAIHLAERVWLAFLHNPPINQFTV